jgi:hypothetical protein
MSCDPNTIDPEMWQQFQAFLAMMKSTGGQMPTIQNQVPALAIIPVTNAHCPEIKEITLLQATYFNNGPKGVRRKNTSERAVCLEVWTDEAEEINITDWQWKRSIPLIEYYAFSKRFESLLARGSITQDYHDTLKEIWTRMRPNLNSNESIWFGLIGDKGDKIGTGKKDTNYYDHQYVLMQFVADVPTIMFFFSEKDNEPLIVEKFVSTDMKGNSLKGTAKFQARVDLCHYDSDWKTQ